MRNPIIQSLLDTDLYKFTMMQYAFHHFKDAQVDYYFQCRKPIDLRPLKKIITQQIDSLCQLHLTDNELQFLETLPYFKQDFINYLRHFRLDRSHVQVYSEDQLLLKISGPWVSTILFEVPILAIISECYYQFYFPEHSLSVGQQRLSSKVQYLKNFDKDALLKFSDFGTRRRHKHQWQHEVLSSLVEHVPQNFIGTSNLYFSMHLDLKPIGTMAHEYLQAAQVLAPDLKHFQKFAFETWLSEFNGMLNIALTDVINMDVFCQDFNYDLAKRYIGLRQDSGDPIEWGTKALNHLNELGISPKEKTFVFSDGLNFEKANEIYEFFKDKVNVSFGIGTNLTNDVGLESLDIVIKMFRVNNKSVIKISDTPGKLICDDLEHLKHIKRIFSIEGCL